MTSSSLTRDYRRGAAVAHELAARDPAREDEAANARMLGREAMVIDQAPPDPHGGAAMPKEE